MGRASLGRLTLNLPRDRRFGERVEVELEADDGGRGVGGDRKGFFLHGEHGEDVAVRAVALGRSGAADTSAAIVGFQLHFNTLAKATITGRVER